AFGESAGAMSLGALLAAPAARGLFRRAILQSGASSNVSSAAQARRVAEHFLGRLGRAGESVEALRRAPLGDLLRAQAETTGAMAPEVGLASQPWAGGDLRPDAPLDALARGASRGVSLMVGTNRDEWKLFMLGDLRARRMDEPTLRRRFARVLGEAHGERGFA